MNYKTIIGSLLGLSLSNTAHAIDIFDNEKTGVSLEGNVSVFYLRNDEFSVVDDGFNRFLFDMYHAMPDGFKAISKLEWGVQVSNTSNKITVNHNGLTAQGPTDETIWLRQGYVGVSHDQFGSVTMGKQWGSIYDVTGVTDVFDIFGAEAVGVYNFGTDGGFSGTGRAEQAIKYSGAYGDFSFSAQFMATDENIEFNSDEDDPVALVNFKESYGASVLYNAPYDIGLGLGYNIAKINLISGQQVSQSFDDILIAGHITYKEMRSYGLQFSLVFADMENHEINDVGDVMNKSFGIELHSTYRFDNDFSLLFGYNSLKDKSTNLISSNGKYHLEYFIVGFKYHWIEDFHLYLETKLDQTTTSEGLDREDDAIGFGMAYEF